MAIDYTALLKKLLKRKKLSKKKHAEYLADEDALSNDISEHGKNVLSLGWDGGFPGCSGAIWVSFWKGFYFCSSSDYSPEGPFESLDEALEMEWFHTSTNKPELDSHVLPLKKLLGIGAGLVSEDGEAIYINATRYILKDCMLVKHEEAE